MQSDEPSSPAGLEAVFLANRGALLRFLKARGAEDAAEDLLHEVWLRISRAGPGRSPVASPMAYLFQVANSLMIDRFRAGRQATRRDLDWSRDVAGDPEDSLAVPSPERVAISRDLLQHVSLRLEQIGPRAAAIFRRHRLDGLAQRDVAREFGISLSTVENDLRAAYRAIAELKEQSDEV